MPTSVVVAHHVVVTVTSRIRKLGPASSRRTFLIVATPVAAKPTGAVRAFRGGCAQDVPTPRGPCCSTGSGNLFGVNDLGRVLDQDLCHPPAMQFVR
jgi:hypothetical protein